MKDESFNGDADDSRREASNGSVSSTSYSSLIPHPSSLLPPPSSLIPHPSSLPTGRAFLDHLLSTRNQYPERAAEIDEQLRQTFERRIAILALDMAGFSRLTVQHGIIHYLAMIHQMQQAARPAVTGNSGKLIKFEAD